MKLSAVLACVILLTTVAVAEVPSPFISAGPAGNLYTAPYAQSDVSDANFSTLCNRLQIGRDDLLIAIQLYMTREMNVVFVPNPNIAYVRALVSVATNDSGLNDLLDAAYTGGPLPATPLAYYITSVKNAVQALGLPFTDARSHDCGTCGPDENPGSAYCGPGLCVKDCGAFAGGCSGGSATLSRLNSIMAYFNQYGL